MSDGYLELAEWRRRVAGLFATWRVESVQDPERATDAFRTARDALFLEHPQSPLPPDRRAAGIGPAWWPYDPAYRMTVVFQPAEAPLTPDAPPVLVAVPSSGPEPIRMRPIGQVDLAGPLAGRSLRALWIEGYGNGIFLPFRDATSGRETYGAGRYLLDTIKGADHGSDPSAGTLLLDFNMAFHPSCAYDPKWVCPLSPPGNTLALPVPVGERLIG